MDCHSLLQGIFPTQGSNLGLLHCREILYHLSHETASNTPRASHSVGIKEKATVMKLTTHDIGDLRIKAGGPKASTLQAGVEQGLEGPALRHSGLTPATFHVSFKTKHNSLFSKPCEILFSTWTKKSEPNMPLWLSYFCLVLKKTSQAKLGHQQRPHGRILVALLQGSAWYPIITNPTSVSAHGSFVPHNFAFSFSFLRQWTFLMLFSSQGKISKSRLN